MVSECSAIFILAKYNSSILDSLPLDIEGKVKLTETAIDILCIYIQSFMHFYVSAFKSTLQARAMKQEIASW